MPDIATDVQSAAPRLAHVMLLQRPRYCRLLEHLARAIIACTLLVATQSAVRAQSTQTHASITRIGERTLLVDASFEELPDVLTGERPSSTELQAVSIPGINLHGFIRELGVSASRIEIVDVATIEQRVEGVTLGSLDEAPLTNDTAADRAAVRQLKPLATSGLYPAEWASVSAIGRLHGRPVSVLRMYPYRYDPARGIVITATRIRVKIHTSSVVDQHATASLATAFAQRSRKPESSLQSSAAPPTAAPDGFEYKIYVGEDGVYRLTAKELADAGIPIADIDARTLKLFADGIEQPIYVYDRGDNRIAGDALVDEYIEFFGERRRVANPPPTSDLHFDQYARYSVYFLSWGGALGKRLVDESGVIQSERLDPLGDLTSDRSSFMSTIHLEEDQIEVLLGNAELNTPSDRFDRRMWGIVQPNEYKSFNVVIPRPDVLSRAPVSVRVALRSALRNSSHMDSIGVEHNVEVYVDKFRTIEASVPVVGLAMLDNGRHEAERLSADKLSPSGRNEVTVVNRRPPTSRMLSDVYVNWIKLSYPRRYLALNDSIEFSTPSGLGARYATFRLRGFSTPNIRVYRRGISRISNLAVVGSSSNSSSTELDSAFDVMFQAFVASEHEKFFAITEESIMRPTIMRDRAVDLHAAANEADFIMIVDETTSRIESIDDPAHALRRYGAFKARNGHTPMIVRAADIYDAFNGGAVSPLAIKRFLAHAYHSWSTPPRYALIFSRGYPTPIDGRPTSGLGVGPIQNERSYVPSIMMQTVLYGATECDYLFGCIEGTAPMRTNLYEGARTVDTDDLIAEIIVGRVAVNEYRDIETYVDKVIEQYESPSTDSEWRFRSLMIGGWEELQGRQLAGLVDDYARHSSEPHRFIASSEFANTPYALDKGRSILTTMSSGVGLVTYLGHGAGGQWEATTELLIPNAKSLSNRRRMAPVLSLTCFTGAYNVDGCLIGQLMVSPNGGAIQALGTPGFGWLRNNGFFAESIFSVMHNTRYRGLSFGEIVALGKALYVGTHTSQFPDYVPTVASMFTIFGDPSLRMPFALDTTTVRSQQATAAPGGSVEASAVLGFAPTDVSATLFDTTEVAIAGATATSRVAGDRVVVSAVLPTSYAQEFIGVRLNAVGNGGQRVSGAVRLPTGTRSISVVRPLGRLAAGEDAVFEIEHHSTMPLTDVLIGVGYSDGIGGVVPASISTNIVGPGLFRTAPFAGSQILPGAIIELTLPSSTVGGARVHTFHVEGGADPSAFAENATDSTRQRYGPRSAYDVGAAVNETIGMRASPSGARLALTAYNWGDRDAVEVPYTVAYDSARTLVRLAVGTVSIPARGSTVISVDVTGQLPLSRRIVLSLAPDSTDRWSDAFLRNNQAYRVAPISAGMIRAGVGFTVDGASAAAFTVPQIFSMTMRSDAARADGVVVAELATTATVTAQGWPTIPIGSGALRGGSLRLASRAVDPTARIELSLVAAATLPDDARIVGYDSTTRLWMAYTTTRDGLTLTATVPANGRYAIARLLDNTGPRIKFSVDGRFYLDSATVARDARFSAVVFDESGIDPDGFRATLDGVPLELGRDVVWLDSTITPTSASLRVQKQAEAGLHSLCATAADRVGNVTTECTSFEVEGELSLRMYGNFPNPFSAETFIAYEIRGASVVDDVEVKIFSTAGKLVRTFRYPTAVQSERRGLFSGGTGEPTAIGYHEVWWDGRDDAGREVANGAYFYRVRVTLDGEEIEEIGTLARIR